MNYVNNIKKFCYSENVFEFISEFIGKKTTKMRKCGPQFCLIDYVSLGEIREHTKVEISVLGFVFPCWFVV